MPFYTGKEFDWPDQTTSRPCAKMPSQIPENGPSTPVGIKGERHAVRINPSTHDRTLYGKSSFGARCTCLPVSVIHLTTQHVRLSAHPRPVSFFVPIVGLGCVRGHAHVGTLGSGLIGRDTHVPITDPCPAQNHIRTKQTSPLQRTERQKVHPLAAGVRGAAAPTPTHGRRMTTCLPTVSPPPMPQHQHATQS